MIRGANHSRAVRLPRHGTANIAERSKLYIAYLFGLNVSLCAVRSESLRELN